MNVSSQPTHGLNPRTTTLSIRQARWSVREEVSVLSLGQLDLRMSEGRSGTNKLDLMMNGTVFNYTDSLLILVTDVRECLRPILMTTTAQSPGKTSSSSSSSSSSRQSPSVAVVISQTKLGWSQASGHGLVLEVRELEATGTSSSHEASVSGVKMTCVSSGDSDDLVSVPSISWTRREADTRLTISQRVKLSWRPSVHILATHCISDLSSLSSSLMSPSQHQRPVSQPSQQMIIHLSVQEKITIQVTVGDNLAKATLSSLTAKYTGKNSVSWLQAPKGKMKLNKNEILALDDIVLSAVPRSDKLTSERRRMEGVRLEQNKCFVVAVKSFAFTQPYQFNFYDVVLQEMVGVFKWLKMHHKREKDEQNLNEVPRDILINIQHFKFELADDPFEVRLRDNYVLKEEEYLESQKRLQIFGQKIEEKRKQNLMFPKEKIEELLTNLSKKNAEIYVQRAKKLFSAVSRTRLFECNLGCLEVAILADPSMTGRDNVLNMMYDSDPQSPWPDPASLQFTTLWCRWIKLQAEFITFHLRDFPQHLLDIKKMMLWGKLAGAETKPGKRATRGHVVKIGHGFDDVMIERGEYSTLIGQHKLILIPDWVAQNNDNL